MMSSKLEDLLNCLETMAGQHSSEPEAATTIETAALALHFIQRIGRLTDFWEYVKAFKNEEAWPKPLRSFGTRDEALAWLRTQPILPHETVLEVAGALHNVTRKRDGEWVLLRVPTIEELEAMEKSEE
ncbi:hypothetical protein [Archangium sp.]|uniref:hypothetical protein n=1 Tax=Archangium sp. TaxID=1872627 RepID=UPI00286AAD3D|nr:hypothetical protein [Archangium sp.]